MERKKDRGGVRERVVDRGVLELVNLVSVDVKKRLSRLWDGRWSGKVLFAQTSKAEGEIRSKRCLTPKAAGREF
ncbi:hypothetical protein GCM10007362_48770 [Saccharibacillus endophyticus]|uniref:Uncharacterized protein n=1 Tax=Saccharibacillus endophyticus TaxID=2060666 RepID=A0ABQ2A6S5_9BACL|nr:hypothetical protein GCM10007362_48770 [Saccharibacillus endophyticus]